MAVVRESEAYTLPQAPSSPTDGFRHLSAGKWQIRTETAWLLLTPINPLPSPQRHGACDAPPKSTESASTLFQAAGRPAPSGRARRRRARRRVGRLHGVGAAAAVLVDVAGREKGRTPVVWKSDSRKREVKISLKLLLQGSSRSFLWFSGAVGWLLRCSSIYNK